MELNTMELNTMSWNTMELKHIETLMSHNNRNVTKRRGQRESFIIASAEGTVRL